MKTEEEILKPYVERIFRHTEVVEKENAIKAMREFADQVVICKRGLGCSDVMLRDRLFSYDEMMSFARHIWPMPMLDYRRGLMDYIIEWDEKVRQRSLQILEKQIVPPASKDNPHI